MEKLPLEIIEDIYSGLPTDKQLNCIAVCKTWRTLMPKPKTGLIYWVSEHTTKTQFYGDPKIETQFYFLEQKTDEFNTKHAGDHGLLTKLSHSFNRPASDFKSFMVGSCNGLVCCVYASSKTAKYEHEVEVYICNPLTEDPFHLPAIKWHCGYGWARTTVGFGYIRSSNKYKVVTIDYDDKFVSIEREEPSSQPKINKEPGKLRVWTLGGGGRTGWRSKTSIFNSDFLTCLGDPAGVFAGGALNWMGQSGKKPKILAFDLEHETFELLRPVPFTICDANRVVGLMELEGNLCVPEVTSTKHITIWELRYRKTVKYTCKHKADHSHWCKKFRIAWDSFRFEQFRLTGNEKCWLWYNVILSCYDPKTKTLRKTDEILKKLKDDDFTRKIYTTTRATSHVHSMVKCF